MPRFLRWVLRASPRRPNPVRMHKARGAHGARVGAAAAAALAAAVACEGDAARSLAPRGAEALARSAIIGGAIAAGAQSGGIVGSSQAAAWPAILAARAGVTIREPRFRVPGCTPPLVAPLVLARWLSGATTGAPDSSCAGVAAGFTPPGDNLALPGATAWAALHLTPKAIAASPSAYSQADRQRYPAVLATSQSQVTATLVKAPTFVVIELGLAEVVRAATSGRVVPAESYAAPDGWTLVPAAVFAPVFDQVADSVAKSGARTVILSVPIVTRLPAFRTASALWAERGALASFGVTVHAGCSTSPNLVHAAGIVPELVRRAIAAGQVQTLTCDDVPGATDGILTPSDVAAIEAAVTGINAHLAAAADARGFAFADLGDAIAAFTAGVVAYSARGQLTCAQPYGHLLSLDGLHPSGAGHERIADAVAAAANAAFGFAFPVIGEPLSLSAPPCG